jgi:hypothetical protein
MDRNQWRHVGIHIHQLRYRSYQSVTTWLPYRIQLFSRSVSYMFRTLFLTQILSLRRD